MARAVQHHQAGQLRQAISLYEWILERSPNHPEVLHLLGVCRQQQGSLDSAIQLIQQAIAQQPHFPDAHFNLGIALKQAGRLTVRVACRRHNPEVGIDPIA